MKALCAITTIIVVCAAGTPSFGYWCYDADDVYARVEGSTITVYHDAAFYNCGVDSFEFSVTQVENTIYVYEVPYIPYPVFCMCCFNSSVDIEDVAPGDYVISFNWHDEETSEEREWILEITVPDVGQYGAMYVAYSFNSGCLSETDTPGDGEGQDKGTWGRVKSLWR